MWFDLPVQLLGGMYQLLDARIGLRRIFITTVYAPSVAY